MLSIIITLIFSVILASVLGIALGYFKVKFNVEKDPRVAELEGILPGVNCGGCGYPGCSGYAEALAKGIAPVNLCSPGGKSVSDAIAATLGVNAVSTEPVVAMLLCQGTKDVAKDRGTYVGIKTCRGAKISAGGTKTCAYGCAGFGDCVAVCQFDALTMGSDGLPHVDYLKCTGCGMCVQECPQQLFVLVPKSRKGSLVLCSNRTTAKASVIKACKTGCIKCEACVRACPEHCISMVNGIPVTDYSKCTSCGICVEKCPTKCYQLIQKTIPQI
ncbi:MAG TPA: RnfABCDGE type electron transport complex subunit B [Spirochaetales bacterium]|nr:RnfABCDGE type electron transport complex subunit B [Spirochaetales bacterium]HOT59966.1 RnfABCDGE type electron transport complex subunit B [Spirochaetales bacterium]HQG39261.1 RnfABCDGE type electron transport complex subunit B [Spirochaetales bacterium]HQK35098.1 RnfABCDGE type electron transport complex subunit B [Spirochaetales bacterium]